MKRCKRCLKLLPLKDFYNKVSRGGKIYKRGTCKYCHFKDTKKNAKKYSEEDYFKKIKHRYGVSKEEYLNLLKKQGGKCATCLKTTKTKLCIDHCHKTNKIRGLLCQNCNRALGHIFDNPEVLKRMLKYLKNYPSSSKLGRSGQ